MNTNEIRCECQHKKSSGESQLSGENHPRKENLEDKFVRTHGCDARHLEEVRGRELRGREIWEWNADLIEAMEFEHVMSQAAQDLDDGETRHESRERQVDEHEHPHERERCSSRNTRTPVQRETTRKLDSQTSRAEEVCLMNACMTDRPHDKST